MHAELPLSPAAARRPPRPTFLILGCSSTTPALAGAASSDEATAKLAAAICTFCSRLLSPGSREETSRGRQEEGTRRRSAAALLPAEGPAAAVRLQSLIAFVAFGCRCLAHCRRRPDHDGRGDGCVQSGGHRGGAARALLTLLAAHHDGASPRRGAAAGAHGRRGPHGHGHFVRDGGSSVWRGRVCVVPRV